MDDFVNRWNGLYFGWIDDRDLYANDGRHVGRLTGREIYASNGKYLGELRQHRLITNTAKKSKVARLGFTPDRLKTSPPMLKLGDEQALELPEGFEDFPAPDTL